MARALPNPGDIIDGYVYVGRSQNRGDANDDSKWYDTQKAVTLPTPQQSMAQEMASRDPSELYKGGVMGGFDTAAYGLKKLFKNLTPEEQNRLANSQQMQTGLPGKLGAISARAAITTPAFLAAGGLPAAAGLPTTGLAGAGTQASIQGLVGAGSGAALNPEDRLKHSLLEGGLSAAGSLIGSGLSGMFRPKPGSASALLQSQGVPITPGQAQGGIVKTIEEANRVFNPGVAKAQQRSIAQWNLNQLRNVSPDPKAITEIGHEGIKQTQASFSKAYQAADTGATIIPDAEFAKEAAGILTARGMTAEASNALASKIKAARDLLGPRMVGGEFHGAGTDAAAVRATENSLNRAATNARKLGEGDLSQGLSRLAKALEALRARQGAATPELDLAYAQFNVLKKAASAPGAMDTGMFSPQHLAIAVSRAAGGAGGGRLATGEALLQNEAALARSVLGPSIPPIGPGTAEKVMLGGGLTAAAANPSLWPYLAPMIAAQGVNRAAYSAPGVSFLTGAYPWQQAINPGAFGAAGGLLGQ